MTGFIGGCLAWSLARDGQEVAGFARITARPEANLPVRLYRGSLIDREAVRWAVRDFQPEAVLHLGAITPVAYSFDHPQEVIETNLLGTVNLTEACRRYTEIKRFIFASSMEVYGDDCGREEPFSERDECRPSCPYAVAKLGAEKYLGYLGRTYGFPWCGLRQTNTYGRTTDDRFVVERLATQMLRGGAVEAGDPSPVRNFIHIDDLVALYRRLLEAPAIQSGRVYNTGPNNPLSIRQLADKLKALTGWQGEVAWYKLPPRPGEVFYLNSTGDALAEDIGWRPKIDLDEGLKRVVAFWRNKISRHPDPARIEGYNFRTAPTPPLVSLCASDMTRGKQG